MTLILRTPFASDFDTLASWIGNADTCAQWAGPQLRFPFSAAELPSLLAGENATSFALIDSAGEFLGFGQLVAKHTDVLRLARIIVAPQRRGFGRVLCERLIAEATARPDVDLLTLGVYRDNHAARSLYSSLGFVETPPHPRPEVLAMQRSLIRNQGTHLQRQHFIP